MKNLQLALMAGIDIPIPAIQANIHQPTIKEIAYIGEENFFLAMQFLCLNKELLIKDETVLKTLTNFQVLMTVINDPSMVEHKEAIITLLTVLFPSYKTLVTPKSILLNDMKQNKTALIDNDTFETVQPIFKAVLCSSSLLSSGHTVYNPQSQKAKDIAEKIMKGRQRAAELRGEDKESTIGRYLSVIPIAIPGYTIENACNLTLYQLYDVMERYGLYTAWDIDLKVRLAGGKPESKADNWMKNIH